MRAIKVYEFNELSEEAKKSAVEKYIKDNEDRFPSYDIENLFQDNMYGDKIQDLKFYFSLGYNQGDGVSFTGTIGVVDAVNLISNLTLEEYKHVEEIGEFELDFQFIHNTWANRYSHARTIDIISPLDSLPKGYPHLERLILKIEKQLRCWRLDKCWELEKVAYAEIEYQDSIECNTEVLLNEDYEYLEDGTRLQVKKYKN